MNPTRSEAEIIKRVKRLLRVRGRDFYGLEDQLHSYLKVGDYDLHWSGGVVINQKGNVYSTILRTSRMGDIEERKPQYLAPLLETLRRYMVLDDLSALVEP